jgi:DNA-binding IclR family transcriptional regulator
MKPNAVNTETLKTSPPQQGVGLLIKAFQLLDLFSDERPIWTQADLARETGLARSTLSRLVRFMSARGFLAEQRGRYTLGFAAIDLGRRAQQQFNLVDLCYDLLEELAQVSNETVMLTGYDEARGAVVCLSQIPSRQGGLRVFENIGTAYPLYAGATAKAVLAFLPDKQVNAVLSGALTPINPAVKPSATKLRKEVATIRAQGYALSHEETYPGVSGAGVPVLTPRGQPLGSVGIAGPHHRMDPKTVRKTIELMLDIGKRITARMTGDQ